MGRYRNDAERVPYDTTRCYLIFNFQCILRAQGMPVTQRSVTESEIVKYDSRLCAIKMRYRIVRDS
jgi:hypothetical protein